MDAKRKARESETTRLIACMHASLRVQAHLQASDLIFGY
jgi:hypothetical protein